METWYQAKYGRIFQIEVARSTKNQLIAENGRRVNKISEGCFHAKTFEAAKQLMVKYYQEHYDWAVEIMRQRRADLEKSEALSESDVEM